MPIAPSRHDSDLWFCRTMPENVCGSSRDFVWPLGPQRKAFVQQDRIDEFLVLPQIWQRSSRARHLSDRRRSPASVRGQRGLRSSSSSSSSSDLHRQTNLSEACSSLIRSIAFESLAEISSAFCSIHSKVRFCRNLLSTPPQCIIAGKMAQTSLLEPRCIADCRSAANRSNSALFSAKFFPRHAYFDTASAKPTADHLSSTVRDHPRDFPLEGTA